jgi:tetratricopeptide (TPR) repeat protein
MGTTDSPLPPAPRRVRPMYVPALGPVLRSMLFVIFAGFAVLGATGGYLLAIRVTEIVQRRQDTLHTQFSLWMTLVHVLFGIVLIVPFLIFGISHLVTARNRPNRVAVRLGVFVFLFGIIVCVTGVLLVHLEGMPQLPTDTIAYWTVFLLHVIVPVLAVGAYVLHRRAGPAIKWKWGYGFGGAVAAFTAVMIVMHTQNPGHWFAPGSAEGEKYFEPSRTRTVDGKFISASTLMMDEYCLKCHADIYDSHLHSAHKLSSFNNPAYLFSVRETRKIAGIRASRWCAGCHDVVPFMSGQFDDPNFDDVNNPTANAGLTCTVCHSITHIGSRSGNGDYTIEEPQHYPFATSDHAVLQWINNQLVKAKPDLHKKTFLKPFHRSEEFCSTCHKVAVPQEVNHYKEFLRGQNHPDSFLLSGVSGHGARSFYYPAVAKERCAECHMPLQESRDFGARDFDGSGKLKIHNHTFLGGNTGIHQLKKEAGYEQAMARITEFLQKGPDGKSPSVRVDLFGIKQLKGEQGVDAPLIDDQPLRPNLPALQPGSTYLVETVIRTLGLGHHFTQGTADSNEVWVEFTAREHTANGAGRILGQSGGMSGAEQGVVDEWSHFINVLMLDRHGNRIDRRNPQDIFAPLYDHQIPPGAGQVVHYRLALPTDLRHPVELAVRVRYRKFDYKYMEHVHGADKVPPLPIVDLCSDKVILPVAGVAETVPAQTSPIKPAWQRWNDYGIGCFLEGGPEGKQGGELGQAEKAFRHLLGDQFKESPEAKAHGYLNLARVYLAYGGQSDLEQARKMLSEAAANQPPAPWQTVAWFRGVVNALNVNFKEAAEDFEQILDPKNRDPVRKFDFTKDWVVINELGKTYFALAQQADDVPTRDQFLRRAIEQFERTLVLDAENVMAHEFLQKCYTRLGGSDAPQPGRAEPSRTDDALLAEATKNVESHRSALQTLRACADPWKRLALAPDATRLDSALLKSVPTLGNKLTDANSDKRQRLDAAQLLAQVLEELNRQPAQEDVVPALAALSSWPSPGLPVNVALTGVAHKGHLQGPLPEPRLLVLYALRPKVHKLCSDAADPELRRAACLVLGRMHLVMHGIFRPDDNARDLAVRRYRDAHPAADRASHSIVIYEARRP